MKGHIKLNLPQRLIDYSPISVPVKIKKIPVNRNAHFAKVKGAFNEALKQYESTSDFVGSFLKGDDKPHKIVLTFKKNIDINERLAISTLSSHGMTLLSVNKINERVVANVSIPTAKIIRLKR